MKLYKWTFWRHTIFSLIITFIAFISEIIAHILGTNILISSLSIFNGVITRDAKSVGIIGGAEGPTAIYISNKIIPWFLICPKVILFIILLLIYFPLRIYINKALSNNEKSSNI